MLEVKTLRGLNQWHLGPTEKYVFNKLMVICKSLSRKERDLKLALENKVNEEQATLNMSYMAKLLKDLNFQESSNKVTWEVHERPTIGITVTYNSFKQSKARGADPGAMEK